MKVSLAISAKSLPSGAGEYYAVVTRNEEEIGKTNIAHDTANPTWTKSIVFDCEDNGEESATPSGSISVQICNVTTNEASEIETFELSEIWNSSNKAIAKAMTGESATVKEGGSGVIAVHVEEQVVTGSLKLQIHGNQLENLDGRFGRIAVRKSDPFYEIKNKQGETLYKSEVVNNDLNPEWEETNDIDINMVCGGNFQEPVQFIVMDQDDTNNELMGVASTTVEELLHGNRVLYLKKNDEVCGQLLIDSVGLYNTDNASSDALQHLEDVSQVVLQQCQLDIAKGIAESKALAAQRAKEHASELEEIAEQAQQKSNDAAEELVTIERKVEELKKIAQEAKELSKTQRCSGTLQLVLSGKDLPDTDGWRNKTDPYFEVYGAKGDVVYKSEVIENSMDPEWEMADVDMNALTNGNLDMKIRITFSDSDEDEKKDYLGQILVSVNDIVKRQEDGVTTPYNITKGMHSDGLGQIQVQDVKLIDFVDLREKAKQLKDEAEDVRMSSYEKARVSKAVAEEAQVAMIEAKKAQQDAMVAEEVAEEASKRVEELMASME